MAITADEVKAIAGVISDAMKQSKKAGNILTHDQILNLISPIADARNWRIKKASESKSNKVFVKPWDPSQGPKPSAQHVNEGGSACPCCNGMSIEVDDDWTEGDRFFQSVSCPDCRARWTDYYPLGGYSDLELPSKDDMSSKNGESTTIDGCKYVAFFNPQQWVDNEAVDVFPEGDDKWDVTSDLITKDAVTIEAMVSGNYSLSDFLARCKSAPGWVRRWNGPYYIQVHRVPVVDNNN